MAKRKKNPVMPDTVWYSKGALCEPRARDLIASRLAGLQERGLVDRVGLAIADDSAGPPWWGVDARWTTSCGATVRSRLSVFPRETRGKVTGQWTVTAEADRPWDWTWPSPSAMYFPDSLDVKYGEPIQEDFGDSFWIDRPDLMMRRSLDVQAKWSWALTVLVAPDSQMSQESIVGHFPASFAGRVVGMSVPPEIRQDVNSDVLAPLGLHLYPGGAVVLPTRPKRLRDLPEEHVFGTGGDIFTQGTAQPLVDMLMRYAAAPWPMPPHIADAVDDVRTNWAMPEGGGAPAIPAQRQAEDEEAARCLAEKDRALAEVTAAKEGAVADAATARRQRAEALEESAALRRALEHEPLRQALAEERRRRRDAEDFAEEVDSLLDGAAREISWLRGELARTGRPWAEQVPDMWAPEGWEELQRACTERLPHVALPGVEQAVKDLRGHTLEQVWVRRCWEALCALEAYAAAKEKHGAEMLPHFSAYLGWEGGTDTISLARYSSDETGVVLANEKFRAARMFPVPGMGRVFMGEHIRVGSGKPPAPRMHLFDDTSGFTGLIHVGYIGKHLPNPHTN